MAFDCVVLVWGDSGVGTAGAAPTVPAHLQGSDSGIKIWTGSSWDTLSNGSNNNTLSGLQPTNWGLEAEFAYQWRQANPTVSINILKLWKGSASLADYLPAGALYNTFKTNAASARAALANPIVVANLSWLGWQDGYSSSLAAAYQATFETIIANSKADLGCTDATRYIIGMTELVAGWTQSPYISTIRTAQTALAAADPSNRAAIETSSYSYQTDNNGHPSATGNVSAGQDFFNAYRACKRWGARWGS